MLYERSDFISCKVLTNTLIQDLSQVFSLRFPGTFTPTTYKATLECATLPVDQLWRIQLEGTPNTLSMCVATDVQLPDDGTTPYLNGLDEISGYLGSAAYTVPFVDRAAYTGAEAAAYPMSYKLYSNTNGFILGIWEEGTERCFSWVCVQRAVNPAGEVQVTGYAPLHCVYQICRNGLEYCKRFVVREEDTSVPTPPADAAEDSPDMNAIVNNKHQVSITEDGRRNCTIPSRANTPRYAYPESQLDMFAYIGADVVGQSSIIPMTVFGENRQYFALPSNGVGNTGMRILMRIA